MVHTLRRWWQALMAWQIRLRLRLLKAQRNVVCRLATGHTYDELHGPGGAGHPSPGETGGEG